MSFPYLKIQSFQALQSKLNGTKKIDGNRKTCFNLLTDSKIKIGRVIFLLLQNEEKDKEKDFPIKRFSNFAASPSLCNIKSWEIFKKTWPSEKSQKLFQGLHKPSTSLIKYFVSGLSTFYRKTSDYICLTFLHFFDSSK